MITIHKNILKQVLHSAPALSYTYLNWEHLQDRKVELNQLFRFASFYFIINSTYFLGADTSLWATVDLSPTFTIVLTQTKLEISIVLLLQLFNYFLLYWLHLLPLKHKIVFSSGLSILSKCEIKKTNKLIAIVYELMQNEG